MLTAYYVFTVCTLSTTIDTMPCYPLPIDTAYGNVIVHSLYEALRILRTNEFFLEHACLRIPGNLFFSVLPFLILTNQTI
jgi:hypothetical protein